MSAVALVSATAALAGFRKPGNLETIMTFATTDPVLYRLRRARVLRKITESPGITHSRLLQCFSYMGGTAVIKLIIDDLHEYNEITIDTIKRHTGPGRPGIHYTATGSTTRQEPPESTQAYRGKYDVPSEQDRQHLIRLIQQSDPDRVDWETIRDITDEAWA